MTLNNQERVIIAKARFEQRVRFWTNRMLRLYPKDAIESDDDYVDDVRRLVRRMLKAERRHARAA